MEKAVWLGKNRIGGSDERREDPARSLHTNPPTTPMRLPPSHGSLAQSHRSSIMGTYVLALWLGASRSILVGRLGRHRFPAGWYLYVGSARGTGGLRARLARHQRRLGPDKRAHWHLDYLREYCAWEGAWTRPSEERLECAWAQSLAGLPDACIVVLGFGASDCRCAAHLVHVMALPSDQWLAQALGAERILVRDNTLAEWLAALLEGNEEERERAALALGQLGTDALRPLADLLTSRDPDARWWATRALAEFGGDERVALLVGILDDPDPDVRACACLALGRVGGGSVAQALAVRLTDESPFVASIAADALSMIGERAVSVLTEYLDAQETHTRLLAVRALSRIRSQAAIAPLFGVLEDPSYLVRHYAQEALEALGVGTIFFSS
jgi:Uri superfamily endonuclease